MFIGSDLIKTSALQRSAMFEIGHRAPLVRRDYFDMRWL